MFSVGDWRLAARGGGDRKDATGAQADGRALAIVLGSVLDGIPESFVLGRGAGVGRGRGRRVRDARPGQWRTGALVQSFAGGALLAMLANSLLPQAYDVEGVVTGPLVVAGFAVSLALSAV